MHYIGIWAQNSWSPLHELQINIKTFLPLSRKVTVCRNATGCTENSTPLYLCTQSNIPEDIEFSIKCRKSKRERLMGMSLMSFTFSKDMVWNYVCVLYVDINLETGFDFGYFPFIMTPTFNDPVFASRWGKKKILLFRTPGPDLRNTQPGIQRVPGALFRC